MTAAGTATSNSPVTEYKLYWDNGDAAATNFIPLTLSSVLATEHTIVGVREGAVYRFKLQAVNILGPGPLSTEVSIRASDVPSQMKALATTRSKLNLVMTYSVPSDNGAAIEEYEIQIYD